MLIISKNWRSNDNLVCIFAVVLIVAVAVFAVVVVSKDDSNSQVEIPVQTIHNYGYECRSNKCHRTEITAENRNNLQGLAACYLTCYDDSTLWPKVNGESSISRTTIAIKSFEVNFPTYENQKPFWEESWSRFIRIVESKLPSKNWESLTDGQHVVILINVSEALLDLKMSTDESNDIELVINVNGDVEVTIHASTYYGARHALESFSQLMQYDELRNIVIVPDSFKITDRPAYKYRGFLLDTARRYYSIEAIKRTIDAMALVKLNVFHWHITDSQSFPMVLKSHPELSAEGAYSAYKIYTPDDIADIVLFGKMRGVLVMPEFDAPSHVGEGWEKSGLLTCYNAQPWETYCVGPPCGQFDVTQEKLYEYLDDIYRDINNMFGQPDLFHMGGDEVKTACWNASEVVQSWMLARGWELEDGDFHNLWGYFQGRALEIWESISDSKVVLWTSTLTDEAHIDLLDKDKYIIHVWSNGDDPVVSELLSKGYDLIMSNSDRWYFDCGFGSWVNDGNNWCAPYKGWHRVYDNNLRKLSEGYENQVLGGEACLWSSVNDEQALDSRIWPRLSALGERLWSDPDETYIDADPRMVLHREFLVQYGIQAESIQPEWCLQHQGECPAH